MNPQFLRRRVAVIGAGIFGVSSAVHLARMGARVTLITEERPASGASGRSLSWLNSARMRSAEYHQLRIIGIDRYRTLAAQLPSATWLRFDGALTWDADNEANAISKVYAHERRIGYDARLLRADEVAAVTPGVNGHVIPSQGAIFNPGEGWVDLPSLIDLLLREFSALGGTLVSEAGRASINVVNGRVAGVKAANGTYIEADAALLAVGPSVPQVVAEVGYRIPDASPIGLLVRTKPIDVALRAVLNTPRVAVRPTPTGALVLDSGWSEREVGRRADGTFEVKDSTVQGLLTEASAVLEGNPKLALDSYGVGRKPIPGDGEPVFGELPGISGYHIAFSHSGATLGLIAGELLADEIVTGEAHPMLEPFRPGRFS
ncbi:NAD(P)/FAD-dependent oxidoreductase [Microvirga tunisiensis]|uniref:FAD-binding oxidoreductase n=1 Tax=Microvirga tunisiensis TaxID=2108360 RepID=A0A5N7MUE5_9HYPH|nr:FAD-binding oxidoreductase [Microvirga tunisiensis]MPR09460.1 FAD-binding oxidoreductase [Microvirga tunisiensis]MPR27666.1 FAD-binding oxidoreductase [Microvirga tunisiensis]